MLKKIVFLLLFSFSAYIYAEEKPKESAESCQTGPGWFRHVCHRLHQVWYEGHNEILIPGYAWHNRYTYSPEKIKTYNENAWGLGLGKGFYDEDGDWHGLYAMAFLDSHSDIEPIAGYAFLKVAHLTPNARIGAGFSVFVTARADMYNNIPFPGALPWVSVIYRKVTISATYIPGSRGAGNVLFLLAKYTF